MSPLPEHLRILLVEDSPGDQALVRAALPVEGFTVVTVDRLDAALEALDDDPPDLVLLDLGLPDSDGVEGVERLLDAHPSAPVVVLTGRDDDDVASAALHAGAQDYVVKGAIPAQRLDRIVRNALERHQLHERLERTLRHQAALVRLGQLALEGSTMQDLADPIGAVVGRALLVSHVAVIARDELGARVVGGAGWADGRTPFALPEELLPLADRVLRGPGSHVCHDLVAELGSGHALAGMGLGSAALSPVVGPDGVIGAVAVFADAPRTFLPSEVGFLEAMARAIGEAARRLGAEAALRERVKEQTAVAQVARLVQHHPDRGSLLAEVAGILPAAMQHPELAAAEVLLDGASSSPAPVELTVELRAPIMLRGDHRGSVRVGYLAPQPFLDEERSLVGTIAESLAAWLATEDAARARRLSEERFRRLAENAPDVILRVALRPEPHFEYVSPAIERLTGYHAERLYDDPGVVREMIVSGTSVLDVTAGAPTTETLVVRHRDGSLRHIERRAVVVTDDAGEPVAVEAIARDVTETRRTERALRASQARLSRVLETMNEGLMIFDRAGYVAYANEAAEDLFEVAPGGLVGRYYDVSDWGIRGPDGEDEATGTVEHVLHTQEAIDGVVRARRRSDGTIVSWETNAAPLRDVDGELDGVVVSLRDVTQRVEADRALRHALAREQEATEHLRHLDQMKNGFLQAVSHELRTPLTGVIGFSALLQRYRELPEAQVVQLIERLGVNAEKLDRLLTDLLDVDRLSRGTLEARRTTTDVDGLIRRTVAGLDGASSRVRVHTGVLAARIDGPRTERIVENLVLNALKHSDGEVDVTADGHAEGLRLTVEDRGPGVPDDLKPRVFEPFQQGDTPAARVGGAGIGLTVVRTFAELHGGRAWVEDRPGGGSRFRVLLPDPGDTDELTVEATDPGVVAG